MPLAPRVVLLLLCLLLSLPLLPLPLLRRATGMTREGRMTNNGEDMIKGAICLLLPIPPTTLDQALLLLLLRLCLLRVLLLTRAPVMMPTHHMGLPLPLLPHIMVLPTLTSTTNATNVTNVTNATNTEATVTTDHLLDTMIEVDLLDQTDMEVVAVVVATPPTLLPLLTRPPGTAHTHHLRAVRLQVVRTEVDGKLREVAVGPVAPMVTVGLLLLMVGTIVVVVTLLLLLLLLWEVVEEVSLPANTLASASPALSRLSTKTTPLQG